MDARLVLLLACFFLSGFAALLYQTAWARELSFVFGTSELAVAAVLAAYMGGLALGAAAAARFASRLSRPVLAYGVLELAIAACALAVPWGIQGIQALMAALFGGGGELPESASSAVVLLQLAGAFAVLLPPTACMGATLPLLARHAVRREEEIGSRVGLLYATNTLGAIVGTGCAAFWLMPELGLRHTVWTGAALNAGVFGLAVLLARGAPLPTRPPETPVQAAAALGARWVLPAMAASGAVSFSYEVLWTRLLGQMLGASVQAFATMLASFLLGIALGSAGAARLATTRERAGLGFALSQLGIALTSYASFAVADRLPPLAAELGAGPGSPLPSAALAVVALLPITLCIGATFPFAVRLLTLRPDQVARATARAYAWNTVGAIAGALGAGFVLLPGVGFEGTLGIGIALSLSLAILASLAGPKRRLAPLALAVMAGVALVLAPPQTPWGVLRTTPMKRGEVDGEILYVSVGQSSTVLLTDQGLGFRLHSNGLPEALVQRTGASIQNWLPQWLGALPALVRPEARSLLVIGLGGGTALEFVPSSIEAIDVIELEPEVVTANRRIARQRARDPLSDPRVHIHIGDARGSLQLTERRYDAIVSQPSHPWTAGASHLYTREFFALVRSHLAPDGVFVQWIGTSFVDEELLRSLLATVLEVFPHAELYRPQRQGLLIVASDAPVEGLSGASRALEEHPAELGRMGIHRLEDFASRLNLDTEGVRAVADAAPLNTDDHNRLASRSAGLGEASLDHRSVGPLFAPYDPLIGATDLDRVALIHSLLALGERERATDLAMAGEGAQEDIALGWVELASGRSARASRHFERALSASPRDPVALSGLAVARKVALADGESLAGIPEDELEPELASVLAGWRSAQRGEWAELAELEPALARIAPGDPLFEEAIRLRIRQRLATGDVASSRDAMALAELLLSRAWHPLDELLRAEAAIAAERPDVASQALLLIARRLPRGPRGRLLAERGLEVAEALPEGGLTESVRRSLRLAMAAAQR